MIESTGIVKRIDDLGRVNIPVNIWETLHIKETDAIEILVDEETECIVLQKAERVKA